VASGYEGPQWLFDRFDRADFRDVRPDIALDAGAERHLAGWAVDACAMETDRDDAVRCDVDEFDIAAVGLNGRADEVKDALDTLLNGRAEFGAWHRQIVRRSTRERPGLHCGMARTEVARCSGYRVCVVVLVGLAVCGCVSDRYRASDDPLMDLMNPNLSARIRAQAVEPARAAASANPGLLASTDRALERIAWDPLESPVLRVAALGTLLDAGGETAQRAREGAALAMPKERSREVVALVCERAARERWTELVPAMLRRYVRFEKGVEDRDRTERKAIEAMFPGRSVEETAFEVFRAGAPAPPGAGPDWSSEARADAWDVIDRVDRDGSLRRRWISEREFREGDALGGAVAACVRELRALPRTSYELDWLTGIRRDSAGRAWWAKAAAAVAAVPEDRPLELRHVEPLRWASEHRAAWMGMSREQLLGILQERLAGQDHWDRTVDAPSLRRPERLEQVRDRLSWMDIVHVLVLHDVVISPGVAESLLRQAELDRRDETTEYGGAVMTEGDMARFVLYMPRGSERAGDATFVASPELISESRFALAHYHFHAQKRRQGEYAGPSPQDLEYARRYGRACLVFTTVREGELGVDYYDPNGVVVDLGTVKAGASR
jgi:hypothetical protein